MKRGLLLVFALVMLALPWPASADPTTLDFDTDSGHFYTQANGSPLGQRSDGFQVSNDDGIHFWREFAGLGGVPVLGYPISRRYDCEGFTCQATQRAILQWDPGARQVRLANLLDHSTAAGRDAVLRQARLVPLPLDQHAEKGLSAKQVAARRLGLLDANPAIRKAYNSASDPLALYGLPTSEVVDVGPAHAVRFQRAVIYQWKSGIPWAAPGQVTVGNAGDMIKESGLLPAKAVVLESPPPRRAAPSSRGDARSAGGIHGVATWYGPGFHGNLMRNGERFNMYDPETTAANIYPLGTMLRVTNLRNGASIVVRVTDRGGFRYPCLLDLSYAAFARLANPAAGVIPVLVELAD